MTKEDMERARMKCSYCGGHHDFTCPRIKSIDNHPNGMPGKIEFHEGWRPSILQRLRALMKR